MVQNGERIVSTDAERYLLVYMVLVLISLTALVIIFFMVFQKRKNKLLIEKFKQQQAFEEELSKSQLEIQEQTLKNVGQELHDNVGQLLAFANMQLNLVSSMAVDSVKEKIDDTKDVISNTIQEVRSLSKSLNNDVIADFGLIESIQIEIDRMNKLKTIKASLNIIGGQIEIQNPKDEIILFRIIQEFFSNTIKYAEAENLEVTINNANTPLLITVEDDGKGFDQSSVKPGSGLINMKSRAKLINTEFELTTQAEKGVRLRLFYPTHKS